MSQQDSNKPRRGKRGQADKSRDKSAPQGDRPKEKAAPDPYTAKPPKPAAPSQPPSQSPSPAASQQAKAAALKSRSGVWQVVNQPQAGRKAPSKSGRMQSPLTPADPPPQAELAEPIRGEAVMPKGRPLSMMLAILLSVAAHVGVAMAIYDKPLGRVDPQLLTGERQAFRISRSWRDRIVEPRAQRPSLDPAEQRERELAQREAALLQTLQDWRLPPLTESGDAPSPRINLPAERRRDDPADRVGQPGEAALPDDVLAMLRRGPMIELPFIGDADQRVGDVEEGAGLSAVGGSRRATQAQVVLAEINHQAVQALDAPVDPLTAPGPRAAALRDAAPMTRPLIDDRKPQRTPAADREIDFVGLALDGTTKLDVPEHLDDDFDYRLTVYDPSDAGAPAADATRAPATPAAAAPAAASPGSRQYFRLDITGRRSLHKLKTLPKDVVFIIDTSGSVSQPWVDAVVAGVGDALAGALNPGDRFNIAFFKAKPVFFSENAIQPATQANITAARSFLKNAKSVGDTDVNRALARLLVRDQDAARAYYLILLSDGAPTAGVMDTRELINLITRDNDLRASIYSVAIGELRNRQLLDFLAYRNRGVTVDPDSPKTAQAEIRKLMSRIRYPLIKRVGLTAAGVAGNEVYPRDLPNIHQGETLSVFGKLSKPQPFTIRIVGQSGEQPVDLTYAADPAAADAAPPTLPKTWAEQKLHHLYSEILRQPDQDAAELKAQIDQLRKDYGVKTLY